MSRRREENLLRVLKPARYRKEGRIYFRDRDCFDFSSNDYLGLAGHPELKEASKKAIEQLGAGACASRLLSGDLEIHHELEEKTAALKAKESALVFNSGYQANVGIISSLYKAGDAVFCDRFNHASILDGIAMSGARLFRFLHNDVEHLECLLKKQADKFSNRLIVTESIFSMDGDRAPLKELVGLKDRFDCRIMVDEAHSTGIFGKDGSGVVAEDGLTDSVDLIMGTFGKALGSFGAYVACSRQMKEYLVNTCRSFIYSTALPPCVIAANLAALELLEKEPFRRKRLLGNAAYYRGELEKKGFQIRGQSQIVVLIVGDAERAVALSAGLQEKGYHVLPIRPPTVAAGQSRLRFSLTCHHSKEILQNLIAEVVRETTK